MFALKVEKEGKDMQNKVFHRLLSQINSLTPTQSKQLQNQLNEKEKAWQY